MHTVQRLADLFSPTSYQLALDLTQAKQRRFSGSVTIHGRASGDRISLHAKDLTIISATIDGQAAITSQGNYDELRLTTHAMSPGEHVVTLTFSGQITDAMHGLYPCYFQHNGVKKELLATQFESHHAREVFPCVDEPAAKATFEVTLKTVSGLTILGNMPIQAQTEQGETTITTFVATPRMSSYLLAFVIGELHKKSVRTTSGLEINVWATPAQAPKTLEFALDIARRSIEFYNDYFGIPYPLPKSDHVALPDFSSGAMENWGLITYRESCLLADPHLTPIASKRFIATVIAHELSHQWFGNLVTMQWWNDLWLNESFANLMEYVAIDALEPTWRMWETFATQEVTAALRRDSLDGVQPVQTNVHHPDEINTLFDSAIVYAKGGRLLNMTRHLIGEEVFRTGLQRYFKKFAYRNTVGDDLWHELEEASGQPVKQLMNQWISQPGLPLVSVNQDNGHTQIRQRRFFIGDHQPSDVLWPIPLFAQPELTTIFDAPEATFAAGGPIQMNCGLSGHFVTHYDDVLRERLLNDVQNLATLDKICLLQDAPLLTRAGLDNSASLLPLALTFCRETNEKVFSLAAGVLYELRKFVEDDDAARTDLKRVSVAFAHTAFNELGWDERPGDSADDIERRSAALALMMYGENEAVLTESQRRFTIDSIESLPTELRPLVLTTIVRHFETPHLPKQLLEIYCKTSSSDLQLDIAIGLTSTRRPETTQQLLASLQDPTTIRPQDVGRWFAHLIRSRESRAMAWRWLQDNWPWIEKTFAGDKSYDDFIRYAGTTLSTKTELDEFTVFFTPKLNEPALARTIQLAMTDIRARVTLIERDKTAVRKALAAQYEKLHLDSQRT